MKVLLQRVTRAAVRVDDKEIAAIDGGLLVFIGVEHHDSSVAVDKMVSRVLGYRLFADPQGKMNLDVTQVANSGILCVSQFTLAADTGKGRRPSFSSAAQPDQAERLFDYAVAQLQQRFQGPVETGRFAADMQVALVNDGPVTFLLEV